MKIRISDLMDECCPVQVELSGGDAELAARIRQQLRQRLESEPPRRTPRLGRVLLLAAALTLLLGTVAYAVSSFAMNARQRQVSDAPLTVRWLMLSESGEVLTDVKDLVPDAGMVFSFTGPSESANKPELRCFYLPSEPSYGWTDADGWTRYLTDEHGESAEELPYIVSVANVEPGVSRYYIRGETSLVKEEQWGDWQVLELCSDYSGIPYQGYKEANFILLFDQSRGYLARVTGTAELETLEHIARELEIRESAEPCEPSGYTETLVSLDPARG